MSAAAFLLVLALAPEGAPPFSHFEREAEASCVVTAAEETSAEPKGAAASTESCLRRRMVVELDRLLLPLQETDPARFATLMKEQAGWNRYVTDACWLAEEAQWVDLASGTRSDGTARTSAEIACEHNAALERGFFVRAMRLGDPGGAAARMRGQDAAGAKALAYARNVREAMSASPTPVAASPTPADRVLDPAERATLRDKAAAIEAGAGDLARVTCSAWPEVATALGGIESCVVAAARYYLALGPPGN